MSGFGKSYSAFDRFQQRNRWLGFPLAVPKSKTGFDAGAGMHISVAGARLR